jgi:hypothetical protein
MEKIPPNDEFDRLHLIKMLEIVKEWDQALNASTKCSK